MSCFMLTYGTSRNLALACLALVHIDEGTRKDAPSDGRVDDLRVGIAQIKSHLW